MTDLNLTPEEQFIINCLRLEFSDGSDSDFAAFDHESFDWKKVYKKSMQWGVAPLLYKIIEKRASLIKTLNVPKHVTVQPPPLTPPTSGGEIDIGNLGQTESCHVTSPLMGEGKGGGELFPKEFLEEIKVEYLISCVAYNSIYESLTEISGVFQKTGIKVKGSHLAKFVYQYPGMRPMGDIDILVKKEDLSKAEELLLQKGYNNQHEYLFHRFLLRKEETLS